MQVLRDDYMLKVDIDDRGDYENCTDEDPLRIDTHNEMRGVEDRRRSTNDNCDKTWKLWDHKYRKDANDDISMSQNGNISPCSLKFVETIKQKVHVSEPVAFEVNCANLTNSILSYSSQ